MFSLESLHSEDMSHANNQPGHPYSVWLVAAGWWEVGAQAQSEAGSGNPIIRRSLSGNCFLYKPFSQVSLFGAESLFGHVSLFGTFGHSLWGGILIWSSPFFDYEVVSLSLKIGCCLVMFALCTVGSRLSMWRWVPIWSCFSL